jgi:hypothetical protein
MGSRPYNWLQQSLIRQLLCLTTHYSLLITHYWLIGEWLIEAGGIGWSEAGETGILPIRLRFIIQQIKLSTWTAARILSR